MSVIRTLLGDVEASSLGVTSFHEHLIAQPPRHARGSDPDLVLDDVDRAARELVDFRAAGGSCVVDGSTVDYGRDGPSLAEAATRSGCHVVATAGFNKAAYFSPDIEQAGIDELEERVAVDAVQGIDGTAHRAGVLKFGTSYFRMTSAEERAARAVCRVQRRTGLPLFTHTEVGTFALEQIELLMEEGVDPARVCIGHLDRNPDPWYIRQVARLGVFLGIDQVGKVKYATDQTRVDLIAALVEAGYGQRILVSGDMARRSSFRSYGGGPGLRYLVATFVPRVVAELRERGVSADVAERVGNDLLVENPRAFLALQG